MSAAGLVRIRKAFALASHETAGEHEALAAVRAAHRAMTGLGMTWDNLTFDRVVADNSGGATPSHLKMIHAIEALEASERKLVAENTRLKRRITELETTVERLEKPKARLVSPKPEDDARADKEEVMEVVETHDAAAHEPEQQARQRPEEVIDDAVTETTVEAAPEPPQAAEEVITDEARTGEAPKADAPKKRNYNRSPTASNKGFAFSENPAVYKRTIEHYFAGKGKNAIADLLAQEFTQAPNFSQVFSVTSNGRPPAFLNAKVRQSGPMGWAEAWLIGSTLYAEVRSWLGPTLKALGIEKAPSAGLSFDLNQYAEEGRIEKLREAYHFHVSNTPAKAKRGSAA